VNGRRSWGNGRSTAARPDWRSAPATAGIAIVIAASWFLLWASGTTAYVAYGAGFIPEHLSAGIGGVDGWLPLLQPLTLTMIHQGILQLAFNLLILIVCGRILEGILGGGAVLALFVAGAYAAAAGYFAADPSNPAMLLGSGGAIGAIVGGYAILAGRLSTRFKSRAVARALNIAWLGATWIVFQLLLALAMAPFLSDSLALSLPLLAASASGFAAGLLVAKPLLLWKWRGA
jgi:membrane associated rhomboid family serine protease